MSLYKNCIKRLFSSKTCNNTLYLTYKTKNKIIKYSINSTNLQNSYKKLYSHHTNEYTSSLLKPFLPNNHIYTTHFSSYKPYFIYTMLSNIFSTSVSVIGTEALLLSWNKIRLAKSLPVLSAVSLSSGINWILKDGLGQLGVTLYTQGISRYIDRYTKKFGLLSGILLDCGSFLEFLSLFGKASNSYFLAFATCATFFKSLSYITMSGVRVVFHVSLSNVGGNNYAELASKAGTQNILASSLGTLLGIGISLITFSKLTSLIFPLITLSSLHLFFQYKASKCIILRKLTRPNIEYMLNQNKIVSPESINEKENFFFDISYHNTKKACNNIIYNPKLDYLVKNVPANDLAQDFNLFDKLPYCITISKINTVVIIPKDSLRFVDYVLSLRAAKYVLDNLSSIKDRKTLLNASIEYTLDSGNDFVSELSRNGWFIDMTSKFFDENTSTNSNESTILTISENNQDENIRSEFPIK